MKFQSFFTTISLLFSVFVPTFAQTTISGIINKYTPVTAFGCDSSRLTVGTVTGFLPGDKVLLIQMKGASASLANNSTFGDILSAGNAGNYEFNRIESVSGATNEIRLQYKITRSYNIGGRIQLVRVPEYDNVTANSLTCPPWDGITGGILVLDVANTLSLQGNIDVSNRGFRGGTLVDSDNPSAHETGIFYAPDPDLAAEKGEGIAEIPANQSFGRGKSTLGGGGGNAHNAGGGGGGNAGSGGNGGLEYYNTPSSPTPGTNGLAGLNIFNVNAQRVVLGGGGGAGHSNDGQGTSGGRGGGIVILTAGTVQGNGFKILANGENVLSPGDNRNDGQGGGGAGGTVLFSAGQVTGDLPIELKGGRGGDCLFFVNSQIIGPGGGGGGGKLALSQLFPNVMLSLNGGQNGIANQNLTNDAQPGQPGSVLFPLSLVVDTIPVSNNILDLGPDVVL
nr:hypothetical protein [Saprospiraceae bacterium]